MSLEFCRWEQASLVFFGYTIACGLLLTGLTWQARMKTASGCAAGVAAVFWSASAVAPLWRFLILPAAVLLIAYWSSGLLFRTPTPRVESFLRTCDVRLRVRQMAAAVPRLFAELLEFSYAAVYALIPLALLIHVLVTPSGTIDRDRFWTVVLVTDFICFGMLPWLQSRPPRAVEHAEPWRSSMRQFNLRLLGSASIGVNTCPSGHAAEALVAALLVSNAPAPVFAAMLLGAVAVSAGAVLGRYHYALDALGGWAVAVVVWALMVRLTLP